MFPKWFLWALWLGAKHPLLARLVIWLLTRRHLSVFVIERD